MCSGCSTTQQGRPRGLSKRGSHDYSNLWSERPAQLEPQPEPIDPALEAEATRRAERAMKSSWAGTKLILDSFGVSL